MMCIWYVLYFSKLLLPLPQFTIYQLLRILCRYTCHISKSTFRTKATKADSLKTTASGKTGDCSSISRTITTGKASSSRSVSKKYIQTTKLVIQSATSISCISSGLFQVQTQRTVLVLKAQSTSVPRCSTLLALTPTRRARENPCTSSIAQRLISTCLAGRS